MGNIPFVYQVPEKKTFFVISFIYTILYFCMFACECYNVWTLLAQTPVLYWCCTSFVRQFDCQHKVQSQEWLVCN